jgi:hypothetical protein
MGERKRVEMRNSVYSSLWDFKSSFTIWDLPALLPIREEGVLRIFIALKNPSPWPGFEPTTFGSRDQNTNHYTTKTTNLHLKEEIFIRIYLVILKTLIIHNSKEKSVL